MMKKAFLFIAALCMAFGSASCAAAQEEYLTVAELRAQTPGRWRQTYPTEWRDVTVDARVILPDVEMIPIVRVDYDRREPSLTAEQTGWDEVKYRGAQIILSRKAQPAPRSVDGRRINSQPEQRGDWYGDFAPENAYVPMSDTTFGEICEMIRAELARFGFDPATFSVEAPERLWAQHWYFYGKKQDALPGHIMLEASQRLNGLPILSHIYLVHGQGRRGDEFFDRFQIHTDYDARIGGLSHLFINACVPVETLAQDVPLCSFEAVRRAIEEQSAAGHIRKVYEVQLGYVLYNEPGVYRTGKEPLHEQTYCAKPMWRVNCLWVDNPRGELRETASYTEDERNSLDYRQLLADAQTGALVVPSDEKDRCAFPGFTAWEDTR